jgi:hypothetical protein
MSRSRSVSRFAFAVLATWCVLQVAACGGSVSNVDSVSSGMGGAPGGAGGSCGGAAGNATGGVSGGAGASGAVAAGGNASGGESGGGGAAGSTGGGAGAAGAPSFCDPGMATSVPVPPGPTCAARPEVDLSGCEQGKSLEECVSMHIVSCGPKCGCSCVALHVDAGGCVTSVDTAEPSSTKDIQCLIDQLSKERFGAGVPATIVARLGACNVC